MQHKERKEQALKTLAVFNRMKFDINHVSKLANLSLSDKEKEKLQTQLIETAEYVKELDEVNTEGIEPISQVTGLENILREDSIKPSLTQEEALKNTKSAHKGFFKVKGILDNE